MEQRKLGRLLVTCRGLPGKTGSMNEQVSQSKWVLKNRLLDEMISLAMRLVQFTKKSIVSSL
jgi:hypothetical protein